MRMRIPNPQRKLFEFFTFEDGVKYSGVYNLDPNGRAQSVNMDKYILQLNDPVLQDKEKRSIAKKTLHDSDQEEEEFLNDTSYISEFEKQPWTDDLTKIPNFRKDFMFAVKHDNSLAPWQWPAKLGSIRDIHIPNSIFVERAECLINFIFGKKYSITREQLTAGMYQTKLLLTKLYNANESREYWDDMIKHQYTLDPIPFEHTGEYYKDETTKQIHKVLQWKANEYGVLPLVRNNSIYHTRYPPGYASYPGIRYLANIPVDLRWGIAEECQKVVTFWTRITGILAQVLPTSEMLLEKVGEPWWINHKSKELQLFESFFPCGRPIFMVNSNDNTARRKGKPYGPKSTMAGPFSGTPRLVTLDNKATDLKVEARMNAASQRDVVTTDKSYPDAPAPKAPKGPAKQAQVKGLGKTGADSKPASDQSAPLTLPILGMGDDDLNASQGDYFQHHSMAYDWIRAPLICTENTLQLLKRHAKFGTFNHILPSEPNMYYRTAAHPTSYGEKTLNDFVNCHSSHPDFRIIKTKKHLSSRVIRSIMTYYPEILSLTDLQKVIDWDISRRGYSPYNYGSLKNIAGYSFDGPTAGRRFRDLQMDIMYDRIRWIVHSSNNMDPFSRMVTIAMMFSKNTMKQVIQIGNNCGPLFSVALLNFVYLRTGSLLIMKSGADVSMHAFGQVIVTADVEPNQLNVHLQVAWKEGLIVNNRDGIRMIPNAIPKAIVGGFGVQCSSDAAEFRAPIEVRPNISMIIPLTELNLDYPVHLFNKPIVSETSTRRKNLMLSKLSSLQWVVYNMDLDIDDINTVEDPESGQFVNRQKIQPCIHRGSYDLYDSVSGKYDRHISSTGPLSDDMTHPANGPVWEGSGTNFKRIQKFE
jgi:hypothetical protein